MEDFEVQLSALRADSQLQTSRFVSNVSYILAGFVIADTYLGQSNLSIDLNNAALINPDNDGDFSWWAAPASPSPLNVASGTGGLQPGRNFIEAELYTQDGTLLQRAFWDASANGGEGLEFTNEVTTVTETFCQATVNQVGFTTGDKNKLPIAIVDVNASSEITGILDRRNLFFRLGTPDTSTSGFSWITQEEPVVTLTFSVPASTAFTVGEVITFSSGATAVVSKGGTDDVEVYKFSGTNFAIADTVLGGSSGSSGILETYYEDFSGANKDIKNYRDMFSALMNEIRALKGTTYWFQDGGVISLPRLLDYVNTVIAPITSGAKFSWNGTSLSITDSTTSGQTTADVIASLRVMGSSGNLGLTRQDGTGGSAALGIPDGSLLYVDFPDSGDRDYSGTGTADTNYKIVSRAGFVPSDKTFVIAYREGDKVIIRGSGELQTGESLEIGDGISEQILSFMGATNESDSTPPYTSTPDATLPNTFSTNNNLTQAISANTANVNSIASALTTRYDESLAIVSGTASDSNEVQGPIASGTLLTIPLDSRDSGNATTYLVGSGSLMVFLNGQQLSLNEDYTETGSAGDPSTQITILSDLLVEDSLQFRIVSPQGFA